MDFTFYLGLILMFITGVIIPILCVIALIYLIVALRLYIKNNSKSDHIENNTQVSVEKEDEEA